VVGLTIAAVPATAAPKPQVITFVSSQTSIHDKNSTTVVIDDKDTSGKTQVGHDVITCNVNGPKVLGCGIVVSLTKGTISAKFDSGPGTITGGTGAYPGATGTFGHKPLNQAKTNVQITLTIK